jgi:hypothetical protein
LTQVSVSLRRSIVVLHREDGFTDDAAMLAAQTTAKALRFAPSKLYRR